MSRLTIAKAATMYKKSRQTLYKAIEDGVLSAHKETKGGRETTLVELSELIRAYGEAPPERSKHKQEEVQAPDIMLSVELAELKAKLDGERQLRQKAEQAESRALDQAEHWRKQTERQTLLLTDANQELKEIRQKPKHRWWKFYE